MNEQINNPRLLSRRVEKNLTLIARILLVDDYPLVRRGLQSLFEQQPKLKICGEATGRKETLQQIAATHPDVTIVGVVTQNALGLELVSAIKHQSNRTKILVISRCNQQQYPQQAIQAGANGYICEDEPLDEIVRAVTEVLKGNTYICKSMFSQELQHMKADDQNPVLDRVQLLTNRELTVFKQIAEGRTTREIAVSLNISVKTVETHRHNIKRKLLLKNSTELAQYAVRWGMRQAIGNSQ